VTGSLITAVFHHDRVKLTSGGGSPLPCPALAAGEMLPPPRRRLPPPSFPELGVFFQAVISAAAPGRLLPVWGIPASVRAPSHGCRWPGMPEHLPAFLIPLNPVKDQALPQPVQQTAQLGSHHSTPELQRALPPLLGFNDLAFWA